MTLKANIIGIGSAIPKQKITNQYFVDLGLDTSDQWITERTGIKQRYYTNDDESSVDLAYKASLKAIQSANIESKDIDLIIVATTTPDYLAFPSTACLLQEKLQTGHIMSFDLSAACSGFSYALNVASQFIENNTHKIVLVVGVDCLSKTLNYEDRSTCILFGDGGGAVVLQQSKEFGILYSKSYADGSESNALMIKAGGSKNTITKEAIELKENTLTMDGKGVFKMAVNKTASGIKEALENCNLTIDDVSYFVCHQANRRILDKLQSTLNIQEEKMLTNVENYGNTSAGSIPILLDEENNKNKFKKNDIIVIAGFGAGFTWSVNIIKWNKEKE